MVRLERQPGRRFFWFDHGGCGERRVNHDEYGGHNGNFRPKLMTVPSLLHPPDMRESSSPLPSLAPLLVIPAKAGMTRIRGRLIQKHAAARAAFFKRKAKVTGAKATRQSSLSRDACPKRFAPLSLAEKG
jgi:hypothetical protein